MEQLTDDQVEALLPALAEAARATQASVERFVLARRGIVQEVAARAHQYVLGRRDVGKSSLLRKIEEMTAVNEARMDMAMSNVDTQGIKIEEEAEKIRANELLKQFKQEMGMEAPASTPEGQKTLGSREGVKS